MGLHRVTKTNKSFVSNREQLPVNAASVFFELFALLEEYGPSWYTKEHHDRAVHELRALSKTAPRRHITVKNVSSEASSLSRVL